MKFPALWMALLVLLALSALAHADDNLHSTGAYPCSEQDSPLSVSNFSFIFDRNSGNVTYDVSGHSNIEVSLEAHITVVAYGQKVLDQSVDLCEEGVSELCPIRPGNVQASAMYAVPEEYTRGIATIAYKIPDLEGVIIIELFNADTGENLGCFRTDISNGNSTQTDSVKYVTMGIIAAALAAAAASSAGGGGGAGGAGSGGGGAGGGAGGGTGAAGGAAGAHGAAPAAAQGPAGGFHAPGFVELFNSVQGIATAGMMSVNYPSVYSSFSQNVGWSVGIISWDGLQHQIDDFRNSTGGNLKKSSLTQLKQATLIRKNQTNGAMYGGSLTNNETLAERTVQLFARQMDANSSDTNGTFSMGFGGGGGTPTSSGEPQKTGVSLVQGLKAYVEELSIPSTNTFMTVLVWFCIIMAAAVTLIMAVKLALEVYCRWYKPLGKNLENFRRRYWIHLGSTIVRVVLVLYGLGVLYCCFQFKQNDSWAATVLAAITLALMTLTLLALTARIFFLALYASREKGGLEYLFSHKPWIRKYGLFYDQFQVKYWWCFVVFIAASFGRNAFLALGYGHGMVQVVGQLVIDCLVFIFVCWLKPFNTKMGNWINIAIAVIRIVSMVLILTFTVELNMTKISTTGTGLALIVVQAVLFCSLTLLIFANFVYGFIITRKLKKKKKLAAAAALERERGANEIDLGLDHSLQGSSDSVSGPRPVDEKHAYDAYDTSVSNEDERLYHRDIESSYEDGTNFEIVKPGNRDSRENYNNNGNVDKSGERHSTTFSRLSRLSQLSSAHGENEFYKDRSTTPSSALDHHQQMAGVFGGDAIADSYNAHRGPMFSDPRFSNSQISFSSSNSQHVSRFTEALQDSDSDEAPDTARPPATSNQFVSRDMTDNSATPRADRPKSRLSTLSGFSGVSRLDGTPVGHSRAKSSMSDAFYDTHDHFQDYSLPSNKRYSDLRFSTTTTDSDPRHSGRSSDVPSDLGSQAGSHHSRLLDDPAVFGRPLSADSEVDPMADLTMTAGPGGYVSAPPPVPVPHAPLEPQNDALVDDFSFLDEKPDDGFSWEEDRGPVTRERQFM
ncbi:putative flavin carrier protein 3 [Yarrowia sp. C11]|nr:putative flavin carrier protein 3 [Yarrowia sp. E02]KAG5372975.1 putative flavin carrier protein 3 [Yarrowia sp. C11]